MAKYFVFMYIEEPRTKAYLDLAISILNPRERWPAHVTMAGPFATRLSIPRALSFIQEVYLLGRGRFDAEERHTVFLNVGSRDLQAHMNKPDYPNAVPHLSLYTGPDLELADLLFEGLGDVRPYGVFYSRRLEIVESRDQHDFDFKLHVDTGLLPWTAGRTIEQLGELPKPARVHLALIAIRRALMRRFDPEKAMHRR